MTRLSTLPSQSRLRQIFAYDSRGLLIWRERDRAEFTSEQSFSSWNGKHAGHAAGHIHGTKGGYRLVSLGGRAWPASRLIWVYHNGDIEPGHLIDHINRIRSDDRIENLRSVSILENSINRSLYKNNKTGACGVSFHERLNKYQARVQFNKQEVHLGYFDDIDAAKLAVDSYREKMGFASAHGLPAGEIVQ